MHQRFTTHSSFSLTPLTSTHPTPHSPCQEFTDGSTAKPWTLDRLELLNTWTSSSYAFYTGDSPLSAKKPSIQVEPRADDEYEVTVTTSDDFAAGTVSAVTDVWGLWVS